MNASGRIEVMMTVVNNEQSTSRREICVRKPLFFFLPLPRRRVVAPRNTPNNLYYH